MLLTAILLILTAVPGHRYATPTNVYSPYRDRIYPMRGIIGDEYMQLRYQGYIIPANVPRRYYYYQW